MHYGLSHPAQFTDTKQPIQENKRTINRQRRGHHESQRIVRRYGQGDIRDLIRKGPSTPQTPRKPMMPRLPPSFAKENDRASSKRLISKDTKDGGKLSGTRASSKVRARTRSKSRVNSASRTRSKSRTCDKSVNNSKSSKSDPAASKRRSSSKKRSTSVDPRNNGWKEGNG
jgi:type IV secretory pathway VirB10-like protein